MLNNVKLNKPIWFWLYWKVCIKSQEWSITFNWYINKENPIGFPHVFNGKLSDWNFPVVDLENCPIGYFYDKSVGKNLFRLF